MHDPIVKIYSANFNVFLTCQSPKICSAKIYTFKIFAVSNEYTLNLQEFFNLYLYCYLFALRLPFSFAQVKKNTDGGRANSDENEPDLPEPEQKVQQQYLLEAF